MSDGTAEWEAGYSEGYNDRDAECQKEKDKAYDSGFIVGTQKAPTYKENQELRDEIERLRGQVTQRGARMQLMREWMDSGVELMGAGAWPVWYGFLEDHPEAAEWFDEEGVPK